MFLNRVGRPVHKNRFVTGLYSVYMYKPNRFDKSVRFVLKFFLFVSVRIKIFPIRFGLYQNFSYSVRFVSKFFLFGSVCINKFFFIYLNNKNMRKYFYKLTSFVHDRRHISSLTDSACKFVLKEVTALPPTEKDLSLGTLVG